ncbi:Metallo-dependent phosphatase [Coemansia reversa NRRL 1564]|uniref:Metallo-dependent phosphatase n=1 Tax=Coemansia reversa (strain ATCC 12441 / NRRL 1564) TaxID=763665 RepID=A0A2G5BL20_COERN|nr:Metallo-dependent phosphatase [Coemansia reversa NRRL 1564]|eukprot:PIA19672.1 Metallo-dependent phosphatase [Coemansia reversa NRRL 1564]
MSVGSVATVVHLLLSTFVLWIVPAQYAFFADLVAFPVSLFITLRDIITRWCLANTKDDLFQYSKQSVDSLDGGVDDKLCAKSSALQTEANSSTRQRAKDSKNMLSEAGASMLSSKNDNTQTAASSRELYQQSKGTNKPLLGKVLLLVVQIAMFAMVLDFVYRPLIVSNDGLVIFRPGYISHDTARLHIRYPDGGQLELRYRKMVSEDSIRHLNTDDGVDVSTVSIPWESAGEFASPTNETDFTITTTLLNLQASTKYVVELHSQQPTLYAHSVRLGSVEFKTAPQPHAPTRLRFGSGSCIKPNFPYRLSWTPDIYGFRSILDHSDDMDMFMFMGDFIYADVPLYFGSNAEDYRRLYRQVYAAPSSQRLLRKVPMLHVYDDHEIKNNWHSQDHSPMGSALTAYNEYNGLPNPLGVMSGAAYYNFTYGNIAFYAWDTRRYRTLWESPGDEQNQQRSMLGDDQKQHFIQWLHDVNHTAAVKFVISSVPLTRGWSNFDASQDTWRGYPSERAEILNLTQHVPNLFYLSGDRHEMAAVELPSGNIEFSTSPVSQFTFPVIGKFKKDIDGERTIQFHRRGHVKYGILDVDTESDPDIPRITYSLYMTDVHQGKQAAWVYEAKGVPWR